MSKANEYDTYIIPPNFIEGGTFFGGLLKLRNTAEALVIVLAIGLPVFSVSVLTLTAKIIILCLTALPLGIIALVGINGESLSSFIFLVLKYLCNRRVITRNEEEQDKRKKRKMRKAILAKTVITRTFEEVTGKDIKRIHQEPIPFSAEEKAVWVQAVKEFHTMRQKYFTSTNNARKDAMLRIIQQITLLLRISAAPNTVSEYSGELPGKLRRTIQLTGSWAEEIVAIGVRHTVVLDAYAAALREAFPNRPLFIVTGATTTFAKRRALRQTLRESGNGILLCTQQSLPSSVNFEFVNKVIIPELHYNNSRMSQFYMRFIRFNSVDWKDIYFLTYAQSIESNQMQMILAKEKLNLFMKGDEAEMDDIYERFGVDYDLTSLLLYRDIDEDGHFSIR